MCNGAPKHVSTAYNNTLHPLVRLTFVSCLFSQFLAFGEESYSAQGRESRRTFLPCIFPSTSTYNYFQAKNRKRKKRKRREKESSFKEGRKK